MGRLFRRYLGWLRTRDQEGFLSELERMTRMLRPVLSEREYVKGLLSLASEQDRAGKRWVALATLDKAVAIARRVDRRHDVLARALSRQAYYRFRLDDNEGAVGPAAEAIPLLEPLAVTKPGRFGRYLLDAKTALALGLVELDRPAEAVPALEQHIRMLRAAPIEPELAERTLLQVLSGLAAALLDLDRPAEAVPYAEEAVTLARRHKPAALASALHLAGRALRRSGRHDETRPLLTERVAILRRLSDTDPGQHLSTLADALREFADTSHAAEHYLEAAELYRRLGDEHRTADMLWRSVAPLGEAGQVNEARAVGTEALTLYRKLAETHPERFAPLVPQVLRDLGRVGEPAQRLRDLEEAVRIWRATPVPQEVPQEIACTAILGGMLTLTASCLAENGRDGRVAAEEADALYREIPDQYAHLRDIAETLWWRPDGH